MGRPKKQETSEAVSNVTDETLLQFGTQALSAKAELDDATQVKNAANGVYRNVLKQAKAAGIDPDVITRFIRERSKPQEQLDMFQQEYQRFRDIMVGSNHPQARPVNVRELRPAAEFSA